MPKGHYDRKPRPLPENPAEAKILLQELNLERAKLELRIDKLRNHLRSLKRAQNQT